MKLGDERAVFLIIIHCFNDEFRIGAGIEARDFGDVGDAEFDLTCGG